MNHSRWLLVLTLLSLVPGGASFVVSTTQEPSKKAISFSSLPPLARIRFKSHLERQTYHHGDTSFPRKISPPRSKSSLTATRHSHAKKLAPIPSQKMNALQASLIFVRGGTNSVLRRRVGVWGHVGLAVLSYVLVKTAYTMAQPDDDTDDQPPPAGILNRCPWPFIFFHDVKQGFRDSPTWMVVTWAVLWQLVRQWPIRTL